MNTSLWHILFCNYTFYNPGLLKATVHLQAANQDVQNMLMTWMNDENCKRWSERLKFIQLMKNRAFHDGIKRAPYTAMFGSDVKVGLASSSLPKEVIASIHTDEELR